MFERASGGELSARVCDLLEQCLRDVEARALVMRHGAWLYNRCSFAAVELGVEPKALSQAVISRFMKSVYDGFLDREPSRDLDARAKFLFGLCLRHEKTSILADRKRIVLSDPDTLERQPVQLCSEPQRRTEDDQRRFQRVMETMLEICSAPNVLSLLSRDLPWHVTLDLLVKAKAHKRGGSTIVVREADDSLRLLRGSMDLFRRARTHRAWTLVLAAIYFSVEPLEEVQLETMLTKAKNIERYARRALQLLREHFAAPQRISP